MEDIFPPWILVQVFQVIFTQVALKEKSCDSVA